MSVGIVISVAFLLMAIATPLLQAMGVLTDPSEFLSNPIHQPPSPQHWLALIYRDMMYLPERSLALVLLGK
jgi:hypothetical protein